MWGGAAVGNPAAAWKREAKAGAAARFEAGDIKLEAAAKEGTAAAALAKLGVETAVGGAAPGADPSKGECIQISL